MTAGIVPTAPELAKPGEETCSREMLLRITHYALRFRNCARSRVLIIENFIFFYFFFFLFNNKNK